MTCKRRAWEGAEPESAPPGSPPEVLKGLEKEGDPGPTSEFKSWLSHLLAVQPWATHLTSLNLCPHLSNRDEHTSLPLSLRMGRNQEDSRAAASTSWAHSLALGIVHTGVISQSLALTPPGCPDTISFLQGRHWGQRGENQRAWDHPARKRWTQHGNPSLALE